MVAAGVCAVLVAGCSGEADLEEGLPQGGATPLELWGRFDQWREVHHGLFEYHESWFDGRLHPDYEYWSVLEPRVDVHLAPTGNADHLDHLGYEYPGHHLSGDCGPPATRDSLELLDADGEVVHRVPVGRLQRVNAHGDGASALRAGEVVRGTVEIVGYRWCALVAGRAAFDSYRIVREGVFEGEPAVRVLMEQQASPQAPRAMIASPVSGQRLHATEVSLAWRLSDADGDELVSHVFFSPDGGDTYWWVLTERHPPDSGPALQVFPVPRAGLESSERARFLVVVSDGLRWTASESPLFTVAPT